MTWNNPPKFVPNISISKEITPENLAGKTEDSQQMALFCWVAQNFDKYPQLKYMFAIPNGGSRHIAEATKLKATGLKAGVPDIFLPYPLKDMGGFGWITYAGLFIEMKVGKGKTTKEQDDWLAYLENIGYYCRVCYGWIEARDIIIKYLEFKV